MDDWRLCDIVPIQINLWGLSIRIDFQGPIKNKEHSFCCQQDPSKNIWIMLCLIFEIKRYDTKNINKSTNIWLKLYKKIEILFTVDRRSCWKYMEITCQSEK